MWLGMERLDAALPLLHLPSTTSRTNEHAPILHVNVTNAQCMTDATVLVIGDEKDAPCGSCSLIITAPKLTTLRMSCPHSGETIMTQGRIASSNTIKTCGCHSTYTRGMRTDRTLHKAQLHQQTFVFTSDAQVHEGRQRPPPWSSPPAGGIGPDLRARCCP